MEAGRSRIKIVEGDCVSLPPSHWGKSYAEAYAEFNITKIIGRVVSVNSNTDFVVLWDIEQELTYHNSMTKCSLEPKNMPTQTMPKRVTQQVVAAVDFQSEEQGISKDFHDRGNSSNEAGADDEVNLSKYVLFSGDLELFVADLIPTTQGDLVHNHKLKQNEGKFLITDVLQDAHSWVHFDEDIHCIETFVVWELESVKKVEEQKGDKSKSDDNLQKPIDTENKTAGKGSKRKVTPIEKEDDMEKIVEKSKAVRETNKEMLTENNNAKAEELAKENHQIEAQGQRKKRRRTSLQGVREKKKNIDSDHEFTFLRDALDECETLSDSEDIDIVLLPPDNVEGDTDDEMGNEEIVGNCKVDDVQEVCGRIEIATSRSATRTSKKKEIKVPKNYKNMTKREIDDVNSIVNSDKSKSEKIDLLVHSAEQFDNFRNWKRLKSNLQECGESLQWKEVMSEVNWTNYQNLIEKLGGKSPVEIFDALFNVDIRSHVIDETIRYARAKNDTQFSMTDDDLKAFVNVLFFSGYHSLPQQKLYWDRSKDMSTAMVFECLSKNKFYNIKKYLHLNNNDEIDMSDKYAKVRPLYDLSNKSLQQFGYWHKDYSIDEQMIPYFGMHSAKQTMRNKSVRFGYKNFVLAGSDGYPYIIIPYSGKCILFSQFALNSSTFFRNIC